jgi:hypothetical protein
MPSHTLDLCSDQIINLYPSHDLATLPNDAKALRFFIAGSISLRWALVTALALAILILRVWVIGILRMLAILPRLLHLIRGALLHEPLVLLLGHLRSLALLYVLTLRLCKRSTLLHHLQLLYRRAAILLGLAS